MALPDGIHTREHRKFGLRGDDDTFVYTSGSGSILGGLDYDDIELTASTSTTETYTIRKDATDIATLLVTYENAAKCKVIRAQRTDI